VISSLLNRQVQGPYSVVTLGLRSSTILTGHGSPIGIWNAMVRFQLIRVFMDEGIMSPQEVPTDIVSEAPGKTEIRFSLSIKACMTYSTFEWPDIGVCKDVALEMLLS
jgi:hypothetical protein